MATQNAINNLGNLLQTVVQQYNPSAAQAMTTTFADVDGSSYTFTPVSASSTIVYTYKFQIGPVAHAWHLHAHLMVDGVVESESETGYACGDKGVLAGHIYADYTYAIQSWGTTAKQMKLQGMEYSGVYACKLHETEQWAGAATPKLRRAVLTITEYI